MAGGYQSQVETHAIHHTQTKTKHRVSSDCSISLFVCLATGKRKTLSTGYFLLISYSHLCFLNLCCVCRKLCDLGTSTAGFWSQNDLPELDIHTILCNFSYLPSSLPHSPTLFLSLSLSLLLSPSFSLSFFPWWLFIFICPQEASADQVLRPSAFPEADGSRMWR